MRRWRGNDPVERCNTNVADALHVHPERGDKVSHGCSGEGVNNRGGGGGVCQCDASNDTYARSRHGQVDVVCAYTGAQEVRELDFECGLVKRFNGAANEECALHHAGIILAIEWRRSGRQNGLRPCE